MLEQEKLTQLCNEAMYAKGFLGQDKYEKRLAKELKEIAAQAEQEYLLDLYAKKLKYPCNENNLLVTYLLGLCNDFDIERDYDTIIGEMPDIDQDFLPLVRDYLKNEWAARVFGQENICSIGTYGTLGIKMALLDSTKVHGVPKDEIQAITRSLEDKDDDGEDMTWNKAFELYPALKEYCEKHPDIAEAAQVLTHRNKSGGVHAGGLIISSKPIADFVPLEVRSVNKENKYGVIVSAWTEGQAKQDLQSVGLVKFDLLVVDGLMQIAQTCKLIRERHPEVGLISSLPGSNRSWSDVSFLNDPKAIAMANKADLQCIFQFGSDGIRKLVKKGGVDSFDDIATYTSLYRPGPLGVGMAEKYCLRKKGLEKVEIHPLMKPFLGKTWGVMCLHEDTFISSCDGRETKIKDLTKGQLVHSVNVNLGTVQEDICTAFGQTREEDGYLIELENGYKVCTTGDHKIWTIDGWKEAQSLDVTKDVVACPERLPQLNSNKNSIAPWLGCDVDVAYLLGQLTGDGCLTTSGITLCVGKEQYKDKFVTWANIHLPKLNIKSYFHCRAWYVVLSCPELLNEVGFGNRKTKFNKLIDDAGIRCKAQHKTTPDYIMTACQNVRLAYLAGLLDSDGTFTVNKKGYSVCQFTSTSPALINSVRKLLAMEGIVSTTSNIRVYIGNIRKLSNLISDKLVLRTFLGKLTEGKTIGCIPKGKLVKHQLNSNMSQRNFCKSHKISRQVFRKSFITTQTAIKAGLEIGDLRYYRIRSITIVPKQRFYGLNVHNNHNLIANGILVKNCYQEQVMQILNVVGDIPLIHCEKVRKAISKKKIKQFAKYKEMFLVNGQKNLNASLEYVQDLWNQIEAFADYGFNRSVLKSTKIPYKGGIKEIQYFAPGDIVYCVDKNGQTVETEVVALHDHGEIEGFEVTFDDGYKVVCSANHKFLTENGQVSLKEICRTRLSILSTQDRSVYAKEENRRLGCGLRDEVSKSEHLAISSNDLRAMQSSGDTSEVGEIKVCCSMRDKGFAKIRLNITPTSLRNLSSVGMEEINRDACCSLWDRISNFQRKRRSSQNLHTMRRNQEDEHQAANGQTQRGEFTSRPKENFLRYSQENIGSARNSRSSCEKSYEMARGTSRRVCEMYGGSMEVTEKIQNGNMASGTIGLDFRENSLRRNTETSRLCEGQYLDRSGRVLPLLRTFKQFGESVSSFEGSSQGQDVERGMYEERQYNASEIEHGVFCEFYGCDEDRYLGLGAGHAPISDTGNLVHRKIVRVVSVGKCHMFDLEVANPTHNFILPNGVVSSNSHSYAYSYISAMQLYLKAHYPLEFYTSVFQCEDDSKKIKTYRLDAQKHGIELKPVHINKSKENFSIVGNDIYYGFYNLKGIGDGVAEQIVAAQPYASITDFLDRFGTEGKVLKSLISLGCFEEVEDRLTQYKFYESYKKFKIARKDAIKRQEDAQVKYREDILAILKEHCKDEEEIQKYNRLDDDVVFLWENRFGNIQLDEEYKYKGELRTRKITVSKMLIDVKRRIESSLRNYESKAKEAEEEPPLIETFNADRFKLDKKIEEVIQKLFSDDGKAAEREFYGFQWTHDLEESPDYEGYTIDRYNQELDQGNETCIEVKILDITKKDFKSGKGHAFNIRVEDADGRDALVKFWSDDYERFEDELKVGNLIRIRVKPPLGNFSSYTFDAPQKHLRWKVLPRDKNEDYRLILMKKGETKVLTKKKVKVDLSDCTFIDMENL